MTEKGEVEGFGKKIKPSIADTKFTVCQASSCNKYLFIGTDGGHLHIYETQFVTHVKTFKRHEAAILTIKTAEKTVFFSGSDSKISSLVLHESDEGI